MPNGAMLDDLQKWISKENTTPQTMIMGQMLSAIQESTKESKELRACVTKLTERILAIEKALEIERVEEEIEKHDRLAHIWNDYGKEIIKSILIIAAAYFMARLGLK